MSSPGRSFRRHNSLPFPAAKRLLEPRLNRWACKCGWSLVTIERVDGTTPMMTRCEKCGGQATSLFYRDEGWTHPTREWRQPTLEEWHGLNAACRHHVMLGGLLDYPIAESTQP